MELDPTIDYHPTLRFLCNTWLQQDLTHQAVNFLLYIAVLHKDTKLFQYCISKGGNIKKEPEKWYLRFLANMKSPALYK